MDREESVVLLHCKNGGRNEVATVKSETRASRAYETCRRKEGLSLRLPLLVETLNAVKLEREEWGKMSVHVHTAYIISQGLVKR
jgi:hypothetical protein